MRKSTEIGSAQSSKRLLALETMLPNAFIKNLMYTQNIVSVAAMRMHFIDLQLWGTQLIKGPIYTL